MTIRQLKKEDLALRVRWMNHPGVYSSMHFDVPVLMPKTIEWYNRVKEDSSRSDVVFENDGRIVAFGGLTSMTSPVSKMAELYVFVDPDLHHKGDGTMATRLLCEWGFRNLELRKIYLYTNEDNFSAIRVYEKCGFTLEGRHRQEYVDSNGLFKDRLYFGLLKSEWKP